MMRRAPWRAMMLGALWLWPTVPLAQPADRDEPPDMPRAGVPPVDDGLPRLSDQERARSAVQMLLVVSVSLVVVFVLLRWFAKANREAVERATQEQEMVDKAMEALERFDGLEEDRKKDEP